MKAIILCRVSTKEQEDGHSIAAQKQRLIGYCKNRQLEVIRTVELIESSTRGERKEFMAMLEFAKEQGETVAIVADAVDRIQRSFKDSIILNEAVDKWQIELHFYREGMVIGQNASASDIMRWDFSVMGAKSYVLQLSENVKRSLEYKRKNGEWSGKAPVGYENTRHPVTGKAWLEIDPLRGPMVVRIFNEYATGAYSINEMARRAASWGLRNKTKLGKPLTPSQIHHILCNPFYCGQMLVSGMFYPHRYDNLISWALFNQCQVVREGRNRTSAVKTTKQDYILRGLLTCATSGRKVTCDLKKGKYVYLICRDPNDPEKKLFVPESKVLKQIEDVFKAMQLPDKLVEALREHLQQSHEAEKQYHHQTVEELRKQHEAMQEKLDRMLDLLLDKSITQDVYDAKMPRLREQQIEIEQRMRAHSIADDSYKVTVSSLISLASRAYELFESSKNEQKRQLINFMFSNLRLKGEKLDYTLRSPFHLMVNVGGYEDWLGD